MRTRVVARLRARKTGLLAATRNRAGIAGLGNGWHTRRRPWSMAGRADRPATTSRRSWPCLCERVEGILAIVQAGTNEPPVWYEFCDETRTSASEGCSASNRPALRHEFCDETRTSGLFGERCGEGPKRPQPPVRLRIGMLFFGCHAGVADHALFERRRRLSQPPRQAPRIYNQGSDPQTTVCRRARAVSLPFHALRIQRKTGLCGTLAETIMPGEQGDGGVRYGYRAC